MSRVQTTTNFKDSNGADLGTKLVTKDYLISVYPGIAESLGISPELWTWGGGANGRLGNGATTGNISTPVTTFAGGTNWKQVSAAFNNVAAIKTDGTLWTWGSNSDGQIGNAVTTNVSTPVTTFAGGTNWKQVSVGVNLMLAIKTDGTLWSWGYSGSGNLGNASITDSSTPVTTFAGGTNWKQVSCGYSNAAIKTDGTLWTWGIATVGKLGNGTTSGFASTPVTTFAGGTNWKQVSCTSDFPGFVSAIKTDGTLWTWGYGSGGNLGNASTTNRSTPVTTFAGGNNWKQVSVDDEHSVAIKTDGTLWIWGAGGNGRLGNGITAGTISTPVTTFAGGNNWKQVSAGARCTAAIKTDGTLWTWGSGGSGRLGNSDTTDRSTPVTTFAGGNNWKQVSGGSGGNMMVVIRSVDF